MIFAEIKSLDSLYVARSSRRKNQPRMSRQIVLSSALARAHSKYRYSARPTQQQSSTTSWVGCLVLPCFKICLHPPFARMLTGPWVGVGGCLEFWFSKTRFCVRFFVWSFCESITKFNSRDMFVMQICVWWDEVSPVLPIHDDALCSVPRRMTSDKHPICNSVWVIIFLFTAFCLVYDYFSLAVPPPISTKYMNL